MRPNIYETYATRMMNADDPAIIGIGRLYFGMKGHCLITWYAAPDGFDWYITRISDRSLEVASSLPIEVSTHAYALMSALNREASYATV